MKIHLPNSAFLGNIDGFVRQFDPSSPEKLEITSNDKWISVHPVALAMVAAIGSTVEPEKIKCEEFTARSRHYFERMNLFKMIRISSGISIREHEPAGRFIPLMQIKTPAEQTAFVTDMVPLLHLEKEQSETMRYIVTELIRNVIEHARAPNGAIICAQYYPKTNRISIGIADTGVGIKSTMDKSHVTKNNLGAIQLALWPGYTGTTRRLGGTEENAGAGLFFIKSIASVNSDFFMLYSGDSMYKLLKTPEDQKLELNADPFVDRHSKRDDLPDWRGTVVGIDITLDQTQEFSALLKALGKTFSKAVRERKKEDYKKPIFS